MVNLLKYLLLGLFISNSFICNSQDNNDSLYYKLHTTFNKQKYKSWGQYAIKYEILKNLNVFDSIPNTEIDSSFSVLGKSVLITEENVECIVIAYSNTKKIIESRMVYHIVIIFKNKILTDIKYFPMYRGDFDIGDFYFNIINGKLFLIYRDIKPFNSHILDEKPNYSNYIETNKQEWLVSKEGKLIKKR